MVVIEAKETNRAALTKGVASLRAILDSKWTPVVSVPGNNVGIYTLGDAKGKSLAGLAVLIQDANDAVIVNIVGNVSLGKILQIARASTSCRRTFCKSSPKPAATGRTRPRPPPPKRLRENLTTSPWPGRLPAV